jgi:hypothetical protein
MRCLRSAGTWCCVAAWAGWCFRSQFAGVWLPLLLRKLPGPRQSPSRRPFGSGVEAESADVALVGELLIL